MWGRLLWLSPFGGWTGARLDIPKDVDSRKVSAYVKEQMGFPDFTPAVQNGFAARMAWSVTPSYKDANHDPVHQRSYNSDSSSGSDHHIEM